MYRLFLFFILPCSLFARKGIVDHFEGSHPWFTGPLFAPSSYVVSKGHFNFEPTVYLVAIPGAYNGNWHAVRGEHTFWANSFQAPLQIGLTSWLDITVNPTLYYNYVDHEAKWAFGDFPVALDVQLYKPDSPLDWIPAVKLSLKETFPTGKYDHLNPKKQKTDAGGSGSFQTSMGLVFGKLWHFGGIYFMGTRLLFLYVLPAPVHLKNFNIFGGGEGTDARFFPSQSFDVDLGIEITLAQHWAFACDFIGSFAGKSHFSGNPGTNPENGLPAPLGSPGFAAEFSLAPALEYNWNANLGVIGGAWFSFAGRDSSYFRSAIIAINYYQ